MWPQIIKKITNMHTNCPGCLKSTPGSFTTSLYTVALELQSSLKVQKMRGKEADSPAVQDMCAKEAYIGRKEAFLSPESDI